MATLVRGPLNVIHDYWQGETGDRNLLDYVTKTQGKLHQVWSFPKQNLVRNQKRIKKNFDLKAKQRNFEVGQKVLILLPTLGHQLQAKFSGPYQIVGKIVIIHMSLKLLTGNRGIRNAM